jgi:tRNA threonylcarbamoyladenosine biosynthesis protein TsaB
VLDAGRGELYHGVYRDAGKTRLEESFDSLDVLAQKLEQQAGPVLISEESVKTAFHSVARSRLLEVPAPCVRDALPLALEEWRARRFHDPISVDANYLRRSDAVVVMRTKREPIVQTATTDDLP